MREPQVPGLRTRGCSSPFAALLRTQFKLGYGRASIAEQLGLGRGSRSAYLLLALIVVAFIPMAAAIYRVGEAIAAQAVAIGQPGLPVVLGAMAGQFMVFFVGISAAMSTLYYSNDAETLLAMPLTGRQIMLSKVMVSYVSQLLFSSALFLPFVIPLGLLAGGPLFWLSAAVLDLTLPALPLAIALLVVVFIMRATGGLRRRDLFRVVFGLVFFVLIIGLQSLNARMVSEGPEEILRAIMQRNGVIQLISRYYPPLRWAAWALTGPGSAPLSQAAYLALFVLVSLGLLGLVVSLTQAQYLGGLVAGKAASRRAPAKARGELDGKGLSSLFARPRIPARAVAKRDVLALVRTPNFLLVSLTNLMVVPILWVFSYFSGGDLRTLFASLAKSSGDGLVLALVAVQGGLSGMNQVSSTAISREGAGFWLSKMIPAPPSLQVRGKVGYSMAVSVLQLLTLLLPAQLVFRLDPSGMAALIVLGMLVSWPVTCICVANDLLSPRLTWTDPHQAMKGNFATLGAMILSVLYLLAGGVFVRILLRAGLGGLPLYAIAGSVAVLSGFLLQRGVEGLAERRYLEIEV
mgnify:CR=1 FL=1